MLTDFTHKCCNVSDTASTTWHSDRHIIHQTQVLATGWWQLNDSSSLNTWTGAGIAQWLERRASDCKVAGSNPCRSGGRIFFSRVNFLCWLLFWYLFLPRVTAVAGKISQSFCQKCRWQVTAKHAFTLHMWLCMQLHGAWLYGVHRTCVETAAVSCGTSHASAVSYTIWMDIQKHPIKSYSLM